MTMISKTAVGIAVGIAGIFVGYCLYFDQKRRSDPDFKKKLRSRRKAKKEAQKSTSKLSELDLKDHEVVQRFFLQEVQLGEESLGNGDVEDGIEHLANAVAVCGHPTPLLHVLQKTLPSPVFQLLLQKLPELTQKIYSQPGMAADDVE